MTDPSKTSEVPAIAIETGPEAIHGESSAPRTVESSPPATERFPSQPTIEISAGALTEKAISIPAPATRDRATLTVITGLSAGQVFVLERASTVIGRGPDAHVGFEDSAISRAHARIVRREDGRYEVEDLSSTNGTFVGGRLITKATLAPGDRVQVGPNVVLRFAITDETEESLLRSLYESSTRDALTNAFNRRYFLERLQSEVAYARRHGTAMAVLMLDVDHFKQINDVYGHLTGDQALRAIAGAIAKAIRKEDVFARYGGEEFAVLARAANALDAERLAERLRAAVEQLRVPVVQALLTVSVSVGVATLGECPPSATEEELLALADARLYDAKSRGRNRVVAR